MLLNLYPYTNGHLMIAPYEHVATLEEAQPETLAEMMRLTRECEGHLRSAYRPHGINLGMNIGESAGAGIAGHIHMHMLPRWSGDANFMTVIGETRVLPESFGDDLREVKGSVHGSASVVFTNSAISNTARPLESSMVASRWRLYPRYSPPLPGVREPANTS